MLNAQLNHVNSQINPSCSFCQRFPLTILPKETHQHLFHDCPSSYEIIYKYFSDYYDETLNIRQAIFKGHVANTNLEIIYVNIDILLILFFINLAKQTKKLPTYTSTIFSVMKTKQIMMLNSPFYKRIYNFNKTLKGPNFVETVKYLNRIE